MHMQLNLKEKKSKKLKLDWIISWSSLVKMSFFSKVAMQLYSAVSAVYCLELLFLSYMYLCQLKLYRLLQRNSKISQNCAGWQHGKHPFVFQHFTLGLLAGLNDWLVLPLWSICWLTKYFKDMIISSIVQTFTHEFSKVAPVKFFKFMILLQNVIKYRLRSSS